MRIQLKEHTVVETHPDNEIPDLRLDRPFDSLKKHIDSINLDEMSFKDHCHVPYLIILYKYLEKWILMHGALPRTYKDKQQLRDMIKSGMRRDEQDSSNSEENFEEAMKAVNKCIRMSDIPDSVINILNDDRCVNLTAKVSMKYSIYRWNILYIFFIYGLETYLFKLIDIFQSSSFWIIAKAVRDFIDNEGRGLLPLKGTLPDMTADTEKYITLQQMYNINPEMTVI